MAEADPLNPFPRSSVEDWKREAGEVSSADPRHRGAAGIPLEPLYSSLGSPADAPAPGLPPYIRGASATPGSLVCARVGRLEDPATREGLGDALRGGIDALWLEVGPETRNEWPAWLTEAAGHALPIALDGTGRGSPDGRASESRFRDWVSLATALTEAGCKTEARLDPLAFLAATGGDEDQLEAIEREWLNFLCTPLADSPDFSNRSLPSRCVGVHTVSYHEAGADRALELGIALATGAEYLRQATAFESDPRARDDGIAPALALAAPEEVRHATFVIAVGCDLFRDLAKLRALRLAWSQLQRVSTSGAEGGAPQIAPARIHAVGSRRTLQESDPWVDALRATEQCWAALLGGAQWITVPSLGTAADTRRLAQNIPMILREESHLHTVVDPAGGSYAIEQLTEDLAARAWRELQAIEGQGGMRAALLSGWIEERVDAQRREHLATSGNQPGGQP